MAEPPESPLPGEPKSVEAAPPEFPPVDEAVPAVPAPPPPEKKREADSAAKKLAEDKVAVAVGFLCTESIEAAMPILKDAGIPVITVGARTITNLLRTLGALAPGHSSSFHRAVSHRRWPTRRR